MLFTNDTKVIEAIADSEHAHFNHIDNYDAS